MTNTLFPNLDFSPVPTFSQFTEPEQMRDFLSELSWKKTIGSKIKSLLKKETLQPIAKELKSHLPAQAIQRDSGNSYLQSLLNFLEYHDANRNEQTLAGLLERLIVLLNNNKTDCENWQADLQNHLQQQWKQLQDETDLELTISKLRELFILINILVLGSELLEDELFLSIWVIGATQIEFVRDATELPVCTEEALLESQFVFSELPCLFGSVYGQVLRAVKLFRAGKKSLMYELNELTDTDGTPHAGLLPVFPQYMDSILRCQQIANWFSRKLFTAVARNRFDDLVERAAAITFANGQLCLQSESSSRWRETLLACLDQHSDAHRSHWGTQTYLALGVVPRLKNVKRLSSKLQKKMDQSAATNSEWAHLACLRNNWYPGADMLRIAHDVAQTPLSLSAMGQPVFEGNWQTELRINGELQTLNDYWTSTCWFSDHTGDFVELRNETDFAVIDRQLFLSRTDHIAILSDSVFTKNAENQIELLWEIPFASQWKHKKNLEGREMVFKNNKLQVNAIPVGLPQPRSIRAGGLLDLNQDRLCLSQSGIQNLNMPIFFDWSPARKLAACDWNSLTVTENQSTLSAHDTFAARVRAGKHQWLYLRNLNFAGKPRSVLGLHTDAETIIAEFPKTGIAEKLVEVQYDKEDS